MSIGQNIKNLRKEKDWTQQELAEATGIKVAHISKLESDEGDPKLSTLLKLTKALECSPNDLLWNEEKSKLALMIKNYAERCGGLPGKDKLTLLKIMDKFLLANALNETRYSGIPDELLEDIIEDEEKENELIDGELQAIAKDEAIKEKANLIEEITTNRHSRKIP